MLFHEYFHGDTGAGIGANHQTGWTGCVARIIQGNAALEKELLLAPGAEEAAMRALRTAPPVASSETSAKPATANAATKRAKP